MDELLELRNHITHGRYTEALLLIDELDEMSKEDKLHKIGSYAAILLIHLIKQHAEKRTARSWDVSIRNAVREIESVNGRRKARGAYASPEDLKELLEERFESALDYASLEAFEGMYTTKDLATKIDRQAILDEAFRLITES